MNNDDDDDADWPRRHSHSRPAGKRSMSLITKQPFSERSSGRTLGCLRNKSASS